MADLTRADELVKAIEGDAAFRDEMVSAASVEAKRGVLDAHGYSDIGEPEMRAYVTAHGGTFPTPTGGELSDQELGAVSGGIIDGEWDLMKPGPVAASAASA